MGTRHLQTVISKRGVTKVSQYGQWDGYPEGQGIDILNFLRSADLDKYQSNLEKIRTLKASEKETIYKSEDWDGYFPHLSRDCGAKIHKMIEDGDVEFVDKITKKEARIWCEGFYTINFKERKFITEYHSRIYIASLDALPTNKEYLKATKRTGF